MPKRMIEFFVIDIFIAIDRIKRNLKNIQNVDELTVLDENTFDAIMRELEIIGEASKYLIIDKNYTNNSPTQWQQIISFRNIVAHEYFGMDLDIVFDVAKNGIPQLEKELFELISKQNKNPNLILAIEDAKQELLSQKRHASIDYLSKLENFINK